MIISKNQVIPLTKLKPPSLYGYAVRNKEGQNAYIVDEGSEDVDIKSIDLKQYDWQKDDRFVVLLDLLSKELDTDDISLNISYTPKLNPNTEYYIIGSAYKDEE